MNFFMLFHFYLQQERCTGDVIMWAKIFKATTWEELKMLATADKNTEQAISSIWQLTEEEKIREQIRYREEREREHKHLINRVKKLEDQVAEKDNLLSKQDDMLAKQDKMLTEKDTRIAELEKMVTDLHGFIPE